MPRAKGSLTESLVQRACTACAPESTEPPWPRSQGSRPQAPRRLPVLNSTIRCRRPSAVDHDPVLTGYRRFLFAAFFLLFALHGWRIRVLHFKPIGRAPGPVGRVCSALRCIGCERVIRIAGIHKIGTGGAQQSFDPLAPSPELRIPGTAAQTRTVSVARIRLDPANLLSSLASVGNITAFGCTVVSWAFKG